MSDTGALDALANELDAFFAAEHDFGLPAIESLHVGGNATVGDAHYIHGLTSVSQPPPAPHSSAPRTSSFGTLPSTPSMAPSQVTAASTTSILGPGPFVSDWGTLPEDPIEDDDGGMDDRVTVASTDPSRPHVCKNCQRGFGRKTDMQRHMRLHTGERPFVCEYTGCGKTFTQRFKLNTHVRTHTGERPHVCEYPGCEKSFGDSSALARHRRVHSGARPYRCEAPGCSKGFTRRATLVAHMRQRHDPNWEADPNVKFSFVAKGKGKSGAKRKRRQSDDDDDEEEEEEEDDVDDVGTLLERVARPQPLIGRGSSEQQRQMRTADALEAQVAALTAGLAATVTSVGTGGPVAIGVEGEGEGEDEEEEGEGPGVHGRHPVVGRNVPGGGKRAGRRRVDIDKEVVSELLAETLSDDEDILLDLPLRVRARR